jgi:rRNA processing protein Krr1/Pno1
VQEETGARWDVDSKTGVIKVRGPEESLKAAMEALRITCGLDKKSVDIPLDERAIAVFVGKNGANIKKLQEDYEVTVNLNRKKGFVTLRGEPDKVDAARPVAERQIRESIRAEAVVNFPNERLGGLMGTRGMRVRQLQLDLNVALDIPRSDAPGRKSATMTPVTIRGTEDAVLRSKPVMEALARGASSVLRRRVCVCGMVWCGAVRCGAVRCGAVRCGAVRCGVV